MSERLYEMRDFAAGDEVKVLGLFETVFGGKRSKAHWDWLFRDNPYGANVVTLAWSRANPDVLAGSYAVQPILWNLAGRTRHACQSLDTMVHQDFRMQGMFENLAQDRFARLTQAGQAGIYGFPNLNSYPAAVRKLGWTRVTFMKSYQRRLSLRGPLKRLLRLGALAGFADAFVKAALAARFRLDRKVALRGVGGTLFAESDAVPDGYEELWRSVCIFEVLSLWKDAAYFKWRYDACPSRKFRYHYLREGDKILALAVTTDTGDQRAVLEFIVAGRHIGRARALAAQLALAAQAAGRERLDFTGSSLEFFDAAFKGFKRLPLFNHVFCLRIFDPELLALATNPDNWTVTNGDSDAY